MGTVAKGLNGKLSIVKGLGRHATWYIPAVLGVMSVANASPEMRMRTLFAEGFGVVGGAFGTNLGLYAGIGIATVLGLGPFGLFIAIFICATAIGIAGNELTKRLGGKIYDASDRFGKFFILWMKLLELFNE
jgi:hypothetical protein